VKDMAKKVICKGYKKKPHKCQKIYRKGQCIDCIGRAFEDKVYDLLSTLHGKKQLIKGKDVHGSQCDIYMIREDIAPIKYYIECKDYNGTVGVNKINKFIYEYYSAWLGKKADVGIFISSNGFSQPAQVKAEEFNITILTFDELQNNVNDIIERYAEFIKSIATQKADEAIREITNPAKTGGKKP
jgi:hypothetical protein